LGNNDDTFDLQISSENLAAAGTATREDLVLNIYGESGNDKISTVIYSGTTGKANALDGTEHWYQNAKLNANLSIDAGAGNDTINTFGSGDWNITLGTGNDTLYVDNSGDNYGGNTEKAVWVFNTTNQTATGVVIDRSIDGTGLRSDANNGYIKIDDGYSSSNDGYDTSTELSGLHGLKLRVLFKDVSTSTNVLPVTTTGQGLFFSNVVDVPTLDTAGYKITDLNINQAIKKAINDDPVLSKLLIATDGPANTLVVTALSDGRHINVNDLQVEFAIPNKVTGTLTNEAAWKEALGLKGNAWASGTLQDARIAAFNTLLGENYGSSLPASASGFNSFGPNPGDGYTSWYTPVNTNKSDYLSAFANDHLHVIDGTDSDAVADNIIIVDGGSSDRDVVVLSTGANSNDTIKWNNTFNNGTVTVANFDTGPVGTPTKASYTLTFSATSSTGAGSLSEIDLPGSTDLTGLTIAIGASLTDVQVASAVETGLGSLAAWDVSRDGASITLTQKVAAPIVGQAAPSVTATGDVAATGTFSTFELAHTLGDDWLDFTAYGARWLGVAQLDATTGLVGSGDWTVSNDVQGAHTSTTAAAGDLPGWVISTTDIYWTDHKVHTGDKYITLTRADKGHDAGTNPDEDTLYKIELWTVNGEKADAYTVATNDANARDTAQLIGYVDLGKVIEGVVTANSVIEHIDYIA
jgi:hypothetical protein